MSNLHIINADSELGAGKRGGSLGFSAMLTAARRRERTFFSKHTVINLPNKNIKLDRPPVHSYAKRIYFLTEYYESLSNAVYESFADHAFPIVVTGDHSSGGAVVAGVRQANPHKRIGVVWIDAHADMHTPYTTPSGNMHGMPLAIAMGLNNLANKKNDIDPVLEVAWNRIKGAGGHTPSIEPQDIFFVGLRSVEDEEWSLIHEYDMPYVTVDYLREKGVNQVIQDIKNYFADRDVIHVSFDVDSMDPDLVSNGTGTPVAHGFSAEEARELLTGLVDDPRVHSLEFTEVNPTLDTKGNAMGETAFSIMESVSEVIKRRDDNTVEVPAEY